MPTEVVKSCEITRTMSQESEFDDALEVPDSLEIMVDENGERIIHKEESECLDSKGRNLYEQHVMHIL